MFLTGDLLRESEDWNKNEKQQFAVLQFRKELQEFVPIYEENLYFNERIPASALDLEDKQ